MTTKTSAAISAIESQLSWLESQGAISWERHEERPIAGARAWRITPTGGTAMRLQRGQAQAFLAGVAVGRKLSV